ncbi:hypothetical protein [Saccharothrix longispora]|uniref:hypothetical protein n=1 Tax=Saccharothrix longispora TaxID=33920 RepID=UPI0028FD723D|nr:hypothetical protein [Saccharothrix longispora]MDU0287979.1 hypothetical protein [Saccharothrix longispora]
MPTIGARGRADAGPLSPTEEADRPAVTAIPADHHPGALLLICDDCGRTHLGGEPATAWHVLWEQAVREGWRGRDRAVGPHHCRHCTG